MTWLRQYNGIRRKYKINMADLYPNSNEGLAYFFLTDKWLVVFAYDPYTDNDPPTYHFIFINKYNWNRYEYEQQVYLYRPLPIGIFSDGLYFIILDTVFTNKKIFVYNISNIPDQPPTIEDVIDISSLYNSNSDAFYPVKINEDTFRLFVIRDNTLNSLDVYTLDINGNIIDTSNNLNINPKRSDFAVSHLGDDYYLIVYDSWHPGDANAYGGHIYKFTFDSSQPELIYEFDPALIVAPTREYIYASSTFTFRNFTYFLSYVIDSDNGQIIDSYIYKFKEGVLTKSKLSSNIDRRILKNISDCSIITDKKGKLYIVTPRIKNVYFRPVREYTLFELEIVGSKGGVATGLI